MHFQESQGCQGGSILKTNPARTKKKRNLAYTIKISVTVMCCKLLSHLSWLNQITRQKITFEDNWLFPTLWVYLYLTCHLVDNCCINIPFPYYHSINLNLKTIG